LFEEERHAVTNALIADHLDPSLLHLASTWTALTADDDPVDVGQIESKWPEEWLATEKSNRGVCLPQPGNKFVGTLLILNGCAKPHVLSDEPSMSL
jgi:hypothetical protein